MKLKALLLILLITIIIIGIAIYLFSQSIRLDEAQTIWVTTKPLDAMLRLIGGDVHVPLYFVIMRFWMQIFGTDVVVARIPSFIFYLSTMVVLYQLCKEASNQKIALVTLVLFALSPFVLWYSFEARMYTQFVFFSSLCHLFFLRMIRSNGEKGKFGFFLSTVGGIFTHYFFISLALTQTIYLIFSSILKSPSGTGIIKSLHLQIKIIRRFLFLTILALACLLPWIIYVISLGQVSESTPQIAPPNTFNFFQTFAFFLFGFQSPITQGLIVALWPIILLVLFFIFTHRKKIQSNNLGYFELVTFFPVLLFFLISFIRPVFLARYLIFTVPTLFFLVANVLLAFSDKVSKLLVSLVLILVITFLLYQNLSPTTPVKENYQQATEVLNIQTEPSDIVAVSSPFTVYPIEYNYRGRARIDTIPRWDRFSQGGIPHFSVEELEMQMTEYQKIYSRVFVLLSYDQGYEETIRNYLDTHFQLLTQQHFSPGLELRVYKLRYP